MSLTVSDLHGEQYETVHNVTLPRLNTQYSTVDSIARCTLCRTQCGFEMFYHVIVCVD